MKEFLRLLAAMTLDELIAARDERTAKISAWNADTRTKTTAEKDAMHRTCEQRDAVNGALAAYEGVQAQLAEQANAGARIVPTGASGNTALGDELRAFALGGEGGTRVDTPSGPADSFVLNPGQLVPRMAAQSTTDAAGGFTVPFETLELEAHIAEQSQHLRHIRMEARDTGRTVRVPVTDASTIQAEGIAEGSSVPAATDLVFSGIDISTEYIPTDELILSRELLEDSHTSLEDEIIRVISAWLGARLSIGASTGVGVTAMSGFTESTRVTSALVAAEAATVTLDELKDLRNSVRSDYQPRGRFCFDWTTKAALEKVTIDGKRSIVAENPANPLEGYIRSGIGGGGVDDRLAPYHINNALPSIAMGTKSIYYGDYFHYRMVQVGPYELLRLADSSYQKKRQVGFILQARRGGKLATAGTPIRFITQGS